MTAGKEIELLKRMTITALATMAMVVWFGLMLTLATSAARQLTGDPDQVFFSLGYVWADATVSILMLGVSAAAFVELLRRDGL